MGWYKPRAILQGGNPVTIDYIKERLNSAADWPLEGD